MYNTRNNISSHIANELFEQRNTLHRSQTDQLTLLINLRCLGPTIWNIITPDITNSGNTEEFTRRIKCWVPQNCPCTICLNYFHHVECVN